MKRSRFRRLAVAFCALVPLAVNGAHTIEKSGCWALELGSYDLRENAERSTVNGRHQVLCGCFDSAEEARASIEQWRAIDITQDEFARLPGVDQARVLRRRPFERVPKTEFSTEVFGRTLTLGGELTLDLEERRDFAFGSEPDAFARPGYSCSKSSLKGAGTRNPRAARRSPNHAGSAMKCGCSAAAGPTIP